MKVNEWGLAQAPAAAPAIPATGTGAVVGIVVGAVLGGLGGAALKGGNAAAMGAVGGAVVGGGVGYFVGKSKTAAATTQPTPKPAPTPVPTPGPNVYTVTTADSGKTLKLNPGDTIHISLPNTIGSGYDWYYTTSSISLQYLGRTQQYSGSPAAPGATQGQGAGVYEIDSWTVPQQSGTGGFSGTLRLQALPTSASTQPNPGYGYPPTANANAQAQATFTLNVESNWSVT